MQGAGWKLTALAASLAVGFVVLMQVQKSLDQPQVSQQLNGEEDPNGKGDPVALSKDEQEKSSLKEQLAKEVMPVNTVSSPTAAAKVTNTSVPAQDFPSAEKPASKNNEVAFKPQPFKPQPFKPAVAEKPSTTANPFTVVEKRTPPATLNPPGTEKPVLATSNSSQPVDPFAAFAPQVKKQVEQKKKQLNNLAGKASDSVDKNVAQVEQELDQWNSKITQASHDVTKKTDEKLKQIAGLFPEVPATNNTSHKNANHKTVVPAVGEKKSHSQELIELTQNLTSKSPAPAKKSPAPQKILLTSGFPALSPPQASEKKPAKEVHMQFPALESKGAPPASATVAEKKPVVIPGSFPAPAFESSKPLKSPESKIKKVAEFVPSKRPAFPAPAATTPEKTPPSDADKSKKKPFFAGFPEATDTKSDKSDDPYRSVPEFNPEKPIREMNREPAPFNANSEKTPAAFPSSSPTPAQPEAPASKGPGLTAPSYNPGTPPDTSEEPLQPGGFPATVTEKPQVTEPAVTSKSDVDPELLGSARVDIKDSERVLQPKVELYKSAPDKAVLGQPLIYTIEIENTGDVAVKDVKVEDKFPAGTKLTGTIPRAELVNKTLFWTFNELAPGERKKILVRVVPIEAGNIGSVSTVSYKSVVKSQTLITAPKLELKLDASEQVAIGETAHLHFVARNTGDGDALGVVLQNLIPVGFEHPAGTDLEYDIGTLKPGEEKEINLQLNAKKPGVYQNVASIKTKGGFKAEAKASLEVIPAVMSLTRKSPSRRFVGHAVQQTTTLKNNSSKLLNNVTVIEYVPAGFRFKKASDNGLYSEELRTITWTAPQLPSGKEIKVTSTLIPTNIGTQTMRVKALNASGHQAELTTDIKVEGFSSLAVRVPEARGPVSRGERVSIRFKVVNRGSAQATHVRVSCKIPDQLEYISANGPVKSVQNGQLISFQPIASLGANQEATFDVVFSAIKDGDARVEFAVSSDQATAPLKHHEQVVIYGE